MTASEVLHGLVGQVERLEGARSWRANEGLEWGSFDKLGVVQAKYSIRLRGFWHGTVIVLEELVFLFNRPMVKEGTEASQVFSSPQLVYNTVVSWSVKEAKRKQERVQILRSIIVHLDLRPRLKAVKTTSCVVIVVGKDEILREGQHVIVIASKRERDHLVEATIDADLEQHRISLP